MEALARMRISIGRELRDARRNAGLSQRVAGGSARMSHSQVGRLERGEVLDPSIGQLTRLATVVGLDLTLKAYPSSDAVRDAGQVRLLERLRARLHASINWRTEVPLPDARDLRAWDAMAIGDGWRMPIEAESRFTDGQALQRRLAIKMRDGGVERLVLLVADTRANRAALMGAGEGLQQMFPLKQGVLLAALRSGTDPGGSGIVIL
jgi:transcriptional regulator with XRE-family HTH domain